ncbi:hypothetical protein GN956_G6073 [Arapaima gigas]
MVFCCTSAPASAVSSGCHDYLPAHHRASRRADLRLTSHRSASKMTDGCERLGEGTQKKCRPAKKLTASYGLLLRRVWTFLRHGERPGLDRRPSVTCLLASEA